MRARAITWPSATARTIIVIVWLPELPPMPATIGISAASATSFWIEPSNTPITRDAMNAVTRLIASHAQRFWNDFHTDAKTSSSSRRPACASTSSWPRSLHEVEDLVDGDPADQLVVGVDDRRRHEVVALERARRVVGLLVLQELDRQRLHHVAHQRRRIGDEQPWIGSAPCSLSSRSTTKTWSVCVGSSSKRRR